MTFTVCDTENDHRKFVNLAIENGGSFHSYVNVYQRLCTVETQLETRVLQCALMGQGCVALPDTTTSLKTLLFLSPGVRAQQNGKRTEQIPLYLLHIYIYTIIIIISSSSIIIIIIIIIVFIIIIYINPYPHYITITTDYPHDVTTDVSIISPMYPNSIAMISPLFTLYPPLKTCP